MANDSAYLGPVKIGQGDVKLGARLKTVAN